MTFKYYKSNNDEVYAYDISDPTQLPYMQQAIDQNWEDVTGSWPPPPVEPSVQSTAPTIEELQVQLQSIQQQLDALYARSN
jgi:hypothetical protein